MRQLTLEDWPRIKTGLEVLLSKAPDSWIPEDVYASMVMGQAYVFEIGTGFAVVQINPHLRGKVLFVWVLYMPRGNHKKNVIPALDSLARQSGCNLIRFHSSRDGWARFIEGDYTPVCVVYERKVNGTV